MLVASVCNPNSLLVPEAEVLEFTSTVLFADGINYSSKPQEYPSQTFPDHRNGFANFLRQNLCRYASESTGTNITCSGTYAVLILDDCFSKWPDAVEIQGCSLVRSCALVTCVTTNNLFAHDVHN